MYAEFLSTDEGGWAHTRAATAVRKIENLVTLLRGRGLLPADSSIQTSAETPPSDAGEPDSPQPTEAATQAAPVETTPEETPPEETAEEPTPTDETEAT